MFKDREDAGKQLAEALKPYEKERPLVLALPRGGVPVGYEIARALKAPLDIIVVRKIAIPSDPEHGLGALAPGNVLMMNNALVELMGIEKHVIDQSIAFATKEMERRMALYKTGTWSVGHKTDLVIVVDDGLATGLTARAAIEAVRLGWRPKKVILAVPFGDEQTVRELRTITEVVCLQEVARLIAISMCYENFEQLSDEAVLSFLEKARVIHSL